MPVLSLPIPLPGATGGPMWLPLRIPFPIMRIGSILPSSLNEPFKSSLLALFNLAWSNKVQLPVLITVCFMAFDIRMQLEINFFWETPRPNVPRLRRNQRGTNNAGNNITPESLRTAALVTSALLQRQRLQLQERARQQELAGALNGGRHNYPAVHLDLDMSDNDDEEDTDTAEEERGSGAEGKVKAEGAEGSKKKRKSGGPTEGDEEDEDTETEDNSEEEEDDDDLSDDEDDDDNNDEDGASPNPQFFGGGAESDGDRDYFSEDSSNDGDSDSDSNTGTPLVVQLEIHQRPAFTELWNNNKSISLMSSFNFIRSLKLFKNSNVPFKQNPDLQIAEVPDFKIVQLRQDSINCD